MSRPEKKEKNNMGQITNPIPIQAPAIESFGAGGQMYMAEMWTGFNISSEQINPLFAITATDGGTNSAQLTNLEERRKIGSTMAFRADRIGIRILNFGTGAVTPAQVQEMKRLLASAKITLNVGSNETKIAEFSGMSVMEAIDFVAQDTNPSSAGGLGGGIAWIKLQVPIEIQANCNVGGTVRFTRAVPAALTSTPNSFGFVVLLQGLKVVKS